MPEKILILGGTAEAADLARQLSRDNSGAAVVTSLAGRLKERPALPGTVRIGGFGGAEGLAAFLRREGITRVIDATHPFAARISAEAAEACRRLGLPLQRLRRPAWRRRPGDRWHWADDLAMAGRMAPGLGRRIFLTVGTQELRAFFHRGGPFYLVRLIEAPARPLPLPSHAVMLGRGPFDIEQELALLRSFAIDLVVTKASGGAATEAKIAAARRLRIPVLMVRRPPAAT